MRSTFPCRAGAVFGAMLAALACVGPAGAADKGAPDLAVFPQSEENLGGRLLIHHLLELAYSASDRRTEAYESLKTPEQIRVYQAKMREFFIQQLSGFPERTPLNGRVIGGGAGSGFRYKKILFDSRPNFTVSAILYLPKEMAPFPAC